MTVRLRGKNVDLGLCFQKKMCSWDARDLESLRETDEETMDCVWRGRSVRERKREREKEREKRERKRNTEIDEDME